MEIPLSDPRPVVYVVCASVVVAEVTSCKERPVILEQASVTSKATEGLSIIVILKQNYVSFQLFSQLYGSLSTRQKKKKYHRKISLGLFL